jgi:hypothetical protein
MLRIRFQYPTGSNLAYSIEQLSTGLFYDFANGNFVSTPLTPTFTLPEDTGIFVGRYIANLGTPASVFTNDDYVVTVHNASAPYGVFAELAATIYNGDDITVVSGASPAPIPANVGFWRAGG